MMETTEHLDEAERMADSLSKSAKAIADSQPIIDVEPVETEVGTGVVRHHGPQQRSALEAAADAAVLMPGVPGRDEFLSLAMTARILAMSAGAPTAVQGNPHLAFHVAMVGRDLGISPSAALELIDIIEKKKGYEVVGYQLSLSPQLLNGQIRRLGLGSIRRLVYERDRCVAQAVGPDGEILGESEFTWDDARDAGLVGAKCQPGAHVTETRKRSNGGSYETCGCNQGYKTYPRRMMWWRAAGFAADDFFPEAGLGLYSPEELGAVVDDEGRPIDPSAVDLPEGYGPAAVEAPPQASDEDRAAIKAKIDRLPPPAVKALASAWGDQQRQGHLAPLKQLRVRDVKVAHALVDSFTARAASGEWGEWVGHAPDGSDQDPATSPDSASPGLGADPVGDRAGEPETATQDPDTSEDETCRDCRDLAVVLDDDGTPFCERHAPEGLIP